MNSKLKLIRKLLFVITIFSAYVVEAQQSSLTLEDIFTNGTYSQKGFGPVRWMKDNNGYSTLETNQEHGGKDIVRYDASTGARIVLVSASHWLQHHQIKLFLMQELQYYAHVQDE